MTNIMGASVWEQELYDYVSSHIDEEGEIIDDYRQLAANAESPAFRYIADLIVEDEVRHHRLLSDLAETIRASSALAGEEQPIPSLHGLLVDREKALAATKRFIEVERRDLDELRSLRKRMKDVRKTTLWPLVVELMERDTEKHIWMLEFIDDRLRYPI